jgi:hypothetical protein
MLAGHGASTSGQMSGCCPQVFLYLFFANNLFITSTLIVGASDVVNTLVSAGLHRRMWAECCRLPPCTFAHVR